VNIIFPFSQQYLTISRSNQQKEFKKKAQCRGEGRSGMNAMAGGGRWGGREDRDWDKHLYYLETGGKFTV
jgi:hypothetical protein